MSKYLCLLMCCTQSSLFAQTALTGGLQGTVREESGAPATASVTLTSKSLSYAQGVTVAPNGEFLFLRLSPAPDYSLTVRREGQTLMTRNNINILSGESLSLPVILRQGKDQVNVEARRVTLRWNRPKFRPVSLPANFQRCRITVAW